MPDPAEPPPAVLTDWNTHDTFREAEGVKFSIASKYMSFGEHTGSHVDAPVHFDADPNALSVDQMPLEDFYTEAVCLDLSHIELKSRISIEQLEAAEKAAGVDIKPATRCCSIWRITTAPSARPNS